MGQKFSAPKPYGSIYREKEAVVSIYPIYRVKYYKKVLGFIKEFLEHTNRSLDAATKYLDLVSKPTDRLFWASFVHKGALSLWKPGAPNIKYSNALFQIKKG